MTTQNTEIGAITTTTLRAIARAAEGCAVGGQAGRALMIALESSRWPSRTNSLLQGLAILSRVAREAQESGGL